MHGGVKGATLFLQHGRQQGIVVACVVRGKGSKIRQQREEIARWHHGIGTILGVLHPLAKMVGKTFDALLRRQH